MTVQTSIDKSLLSFLFQVCQIASAQLVSKEFITLNQHETHAQLCFSLLHRSPPGQTFISDFQLLHQIQNCATVHVLIIKE